MQTKGATTILLDLDVHDTLDLLLEPAFQYGDPLQSNLGIYKFDFGVNKKRMIHLNKPKHTLQPKTPCNNWNPNIRFGLRADFIKTEDYEINGEQCPDQFDEGCLRNLRNSPNEIERITQRTPEIDAMDAAMIMQLRETLKDDFYRVAYFGNKNFAAFVEQGYYDLTGYTPDEKENLIRMMSVTYGWFAEITARTLEPDDRHRIRYIDTNNGTVQGNAMRPENIVAFLKNMRMRAKTVLKNWHRNKPLAQRPKYYLQPGLYNAYKEYLRAGGTEAAYQFSIDGEEIVGVLKFDNFLVMEMPDWEVWDSEVGNIDPNTGYSYTQRALFTVDENLCGLINSQALEEYPSSGLLIQTSPLIRDKGRKDMYGAFSFGFGVAQPSLMVAGYNSSREYN